MKRFWFFTSCLLFVLAACAPKLTPAPTPTAIPPTAVPTAVDPWKIVGTSTGIMQSVNYAGFMDPSFGITVGNDGETHFTTDGGASWPVADNKSLCLFGLDIVDSKVAWSCGNGSHIRVSTDGGKTWKAVANYGADEPDQCRFLSFLDVTTGWAATPSKLGITVDGGQTWKELILPQGIQDIAAIDLQSASDGFIMDIAGKLYITKDGGQTWTAQPLDFAQTIFQHILPAPLVAMRFTDAMHGLIVLGLGNTDAGYTITSAYTVDGGKTWQLDPLPIAKGAPNLYLSHDGRTLTVDARDETLTILRFQRP